MTTPEWVTAGIGIGQFLLGVIGLVLVVRQLQRMAEANEIAAKAQQAAAESTKIAADAANLSAAMAVVQLEQAVASSRDQLAAYSAEMIQRKDDPKFLDAAVLRMPELLEQYLNNADRLCSYIIRGYIDEENYKEDFRNWLIETVRDHREKFGPDCRHRNILHVHHAWADGKKARRAV